MNLANRSYEEKRDFIRMKVDTPVDVTLDQQHRWQGKCHNLSGGGMLISLPEPPPLNAELEVTVSSRHGHSPMLKARVKVSRVGSEHRRPDPAEPASPQSPQNCYVGLKILSLLD